MVDVQDVLVRLPESILPLSDHDAVRIQSFINDAEEIIADEFLRSGRDLDAETAMVPWLHRAVIRTVREMAAASLIIGPHVGLQSASSTTGPQSDSASYRDVPMVSFSGPKLTNELREDLGLPVTVQARWRFPKPRTWPERRWR